jgi:amino acid adenylation domain-containing protein
MSSLPDSPPERISTPAGEQPAELRQRLAALSPEKQALLEQRLLARRAVREPPAIVPREDRALAPLSFVQELMWLLHELTPGTHAYNSSGARRLHGALDVDALRHALNVVVDRHEALRTTFEVRDGEPVQLINEQVPIELAVIETPGLEDEALTQLLRELVRRPFDLRVPPLLRATLLRLGPEDHVLLTSANHIVWDGWSKGIFFSELAELYDATVTGREPALAELTIQYADFAVWQRRWLQGELVERQLAHWRERLAGAPLLLELPTDHPRPPVHGQRGDRLELWVPAATLAALKALSQERGVTLFMTLVAAWATFLHRFTGECDIVLGTPIAGRNRLELEGLIGYFTNTLALRVSCAGDPPFAELLGRVREVALDAYAHQDVSFEQVVREVAPRRDLSHSPIFQSLIVLQNAASETLELRGLSMEMIVTEPGTAKFDLSLGMGEYEGELHASFEYNLDLFERATIERVRAHFAALLQAIVAQPTRRLSQLELLAPAEAQLADATVRGAATAIPDVTLHGLLRERAPAVAAEIAIVDGERELTYAELLARSEALASLLRAQGVRAGEYVGLCLERSAELVIAQLAILQAGAACVPLDPAYPAERRRLMAGDAGIRLALTSERLAADVQALGLAALCVDGAAGFTGERAAARTPGPIAPVESPPAESQGDPRDVAFLLYTSGSTGLPKGVLLEHRGLVNHALASIPRFDLKPGERVLQFASPSFDISLEEIFCTLLSGATLVIRDAAMPLGGPELVEWLTRARVSVMDLPTAFWHEWVRDLDELGLAPPPSLRLVIVGGEQASAAALARWRGLSDPPVRWINTYGPTETSIVASVYEPPSDWSHVPGQELPIGWPLENVSIHVLDRDTRPVPPGVKGELYIGGPGLARGYLGRERETEARFPRPLAAGGERLYRTGDTVRRRADGALEFLGREDEQLKLHGFRIEPREIEDALIEHPGVEEALAVVRENAQGQPLLVAYAVVGDPTEQGLPAVLRRHLAERLPAFAVPTSVLALAKLPLTANGKVDRAALPAPADRPRIPTHPADELEAALMEIWSELLGHVPGVTESFFELGGHSLLAVRMFALIERRLEVRLPLATLMRSPTIAELAAEVRRERIEQRPWEVLVPLKQSGTRPPLFLIHELRGEVLCYRDLVARLDPEQPAYGLEAVGRDGRAVPITRVEDMARRYLEDVRSVQPHGPYLLAGLCIGGNIAYQMAHQLEREGERVAFVGLIDAHPFGLRREAGTGGLLAAHLRELRELPLRARPRFLAESARNAWRRQRAALWWRISKQLYLDRGRPLPARLNDPEALNQMAAHGYVTPGYGGRVTLFPAGRLNRESGQDRRLRWGELARGGMEVRELAADGVAHLTLLKEPHVARLAGELEAAIAAALQAEPR